MANTFGHLFRVTTFGESHGGAVGVVIDGCPAGYAIDLEMVQLLLNRRRPGQGGVTSPRKEPDQILCLSGLENNITLGTPITLLAHNTDKKPQDYNDLQDVLRPSHADYTTLSKYGIRPTSGGGRASARETLGRVAAAAIAEQILTSYLPEFAVVAYVDSVKGLAINQTSNDLNHLKRQIIDQSPLRCPPSINEQDLLQIVEQAQEDGDTVGGTITCRVQGVPPGLGEPVFDKLEADLAKAMLSLPACRGFEIGSGFAGTTLQGSQHNDEFYKDEGRIKTRSNHSGGIQGGISNGEDIIFRVAFKPVSTIFKQQHTISADGFPISFKPASGRHDACVLPRAVPMIEAMAVLVLMDHLLRQLGTDLQGQWHK